ncbi:MAG: OmpA family protein [Deltaproteobacteria bacterium]|nr:OmpA family protein [Deltaproteobacteria bacterium]
MIARHVGTRTCASPGSALRPVILAFAFLSALATTAGCTRGAVMQGRIDGSREIAEQAARNGAYRCAPRELALARAHLAFAEAELAQGNYGRADEEYAIAEPNARAAYRLSPAARCLGRATVGCPDRDSDGICDATDECPDDPEDMDGNLDEDGCPEGEDADGDGIIDDRDHCPLEPEDRDTFLDDDGCPDPDNDADGIRDASDSCADEPEDPDSFQDDNGCPEPDNDSDTVLDVNDRCPNEPGPVDNEGCPRVYQDVVVTGSEIRIMQQIFFEFDRAVIRSVSFPILDTVAQVMRDYPTITVEIQGHTDSRGNDDYNLRLSDQRAASVRDYLMRAGIDASRMTSRGYGETRPIESNSTNEGRARNRRVQFIRTDSGAQQQQ